LALLLAALTAAFVASSVDASDGLIDVFIMAVYVLFGGSLVFSIQWRVLRRRLARYAERLEATAGRG
jgi:hypothetical protein